MSYDDDLDHQRWVTPFCTQLLHANFLFAQAHTNQTQEQWNERVRVALREITPEIVGDLLSHEGWRPQLTGAWFCGLKGWSDFDLTIGRNLVRHRQGVVSQGYSFALARFPSHASANYLRGRLNLAFKKDFWEDSIDWLIGALLWVDEKIGTSHAEDYIGPWNERLRRAAEDAENSAHKHFETDTALAAQERFRLIMRYVKTHFDNADNPRKSLR